jgi:hypothetical protein
VSSLFENKRRGDRLGGIEGNELLTCATAVVLTVLLVAEGITILRMRGLVTVHMFIGMVLIPPLALKLGSTGYRFARYYSRARAYREKGPPLLALRLMAPVLVATTVLVFLTGVLLLAVAHKSNFLLELHKVSFIVWGVGFGIHFLAYTARVLRSLQAARGRGVRGAGVRAMLVAAALGGGVALALELLPQMSGWRA